MVVFSGSILLCIPISIEKYYEGKILELFGIGRHQRPVHIKNDFSSKASRCSLSRAVVYLAYILVKGIKALAKCIESNPNLKKLNINDNTVTENGALAIGEALENCKNLETLDMGDCLIRNKGGLMNNV